MKTASEIRESVLQFLEDKVPALITVYNIRTGQYIFVNKALIKILGYKPEKFLSGGTNFATSIVHPEDIGRIMAENQKALKEATSAKKQSFDQIINFEYRMKHKDGRWIWFHTDGGVFSRNKKGKVESVLNISVDITHRKDREIQTKRELSESESRYKVFLSQSSEGMWRFELEKPVDISLRPPKQIKLFYKYAYLAECNDALAKMYGYKKSEDIIGARLASFLPKEDKKNIDYLTSFIESQYNLASAISYEFDKEGKQKIFRNSLVGIIENEKIVRAWGTQSEVTKEKTFQERLEFLEEVNKKLVVSLDQTITLQEITKLAINYIADYCRIATIDDRGGIIEIAANHRDPTKVSLVKDLFESYKNDESVTYGIPTLLKKGKAELISVVDDKLLEAYKTNKKLIRIVKKIGLKSYMGFPLIARKKIIGAITFSSVKEGRYYTKEDLNFARILAARISLTIDNFRLYNDAQKAITTRENFISIASHELRTPVTSLKIYTELLRRQTSKSNGKKSLLLTKVNSQVKKLTKLVGDLLDVSRIQTGKLEFHFEKLNFDNFIKNVVEDAKNLYRGRDIIIKGNVGKKVYADKNRIEQVVMNLINNAMKYSPENKTVIIHLSSQGNHALLSVEDFGVGIEKNHQKKIFDRFYRVDMEGQETFPGLGIGLYISKEIILRHGGKIKVSSARNKGTIFSFTLPYYKHKPANVIHNQN